jgi:hypothetical protein
MRKEKKERMSTDLTTLFMEVMRMNKTKEQMPQIAEIKEEQTTAE